MTNTTAGQSQTVTNFPEGSFTPVPDLIPFSLGAPAVSPAPTIRKDEIVRRLREMGATSAGRLTWNEREAVLAAVYKLEMQP